MKNRAQTLSRNQVITTVRKSDGTQTQIGIPKVVWTENFRVINAGQIHGDRKSPYPIEFDHEIRNYLVGHSTGSDASYEYEWDGPYFGMTSPWPVVSFSGWYPPNLYNSVLSRVNHQVRTNLDLSIDAFQNRQTLSLFKNATRYIEYVRNFRPGRGGFKRLWQDYQASDERTIKRVGSKWLEFVYGVKPLAQDVYESVQEVYRRVPQLLVAEAKGSEMTKGSGTQANPANGGLTEKFTYEQENRVRIHILYAPSTSTLNTIAQFTSLNPASIAWELTPWSFVVDWFYDVGGYLRNVETCLLSGNQFKNGYATEGHRFHSVHEWRSPSNPRNWYDCTGQTYTRKRRTVFLSHPAPRLPRFQAELGSQRLLNAAALLSQFMGKKPRSSSPVTFDRTRPVSYFNWGSDKRP